MANNCTRCFCSSLPRPYRFAFMPIPLADLQIRLEMPTDLYQPGVAQSPLILARGSSRQRPPPPLPPPPMALPPASSSGSSKISSSLFLSSRYLSSTRIRWRIFEQRITGLSPAAVPSAVAHWRVGGRRSSSGISI